MKILFCADPLRPRQVDQAFQVEYDAARRAGAEASLFGFEALVMDK